MRHFCLCVALLGGAALPARAADWPQWMGPNRDGIWAETGTLDKFPAGGLKALWRAPIAGGYSGPSVAGGKAFVHDLKTEGDVKKASQPFPPKDGLKGTERLLCLDAKKGTVLWKYEYPITAKVSYPAGPRATPTVAGGRVYGLGMVGDLFCLDVKDGKKVWAKNLPKEYGYAVPLWGFCSHPLVVGKRLYCVVGGKGSGVVCFDAATGKEIWKALDVKEAGYSHPRLIEAGGTKQLIVWHPAAIVSLSPEDGKEYWSVPLQPMYGMSIMAPVHSGDYLFAGGLFNKSVLLKLASDRPGAEVVWRGKRDLGVGPVNMTPLIEGNTIYGVDQPGTFMAVDLLTGKRLWTTYAPTTGAKNENSATAFLVKNGDKHFLFNEKGELIIAKLSRKEYREVSRAKLVEPTGFAFSRDVVWSHPAFAGGCVFVRNDKEIACFSLKAK